MWFILFFLESWFGSNLKWFWWRTLIKREFYRKFIKLDGGILASKRGNRILKRKFKRVYLWTKKSVWVDFWVIIVILRSFNLKRKIG